MTLALVMAAAATLIMGLLFLVGFRRAMRRGMGLTPRDAGNQLLPAVPSAEAAARETEDPRLTPGGTIASSYVGESSFSAAASKSQQAALNYLLGGIAFALSETAIGFWLTPLQPSTFRVALVAHVALWPTLLSLWLLHQRRWLRRWMLVYGLVLLAFCIRAGFSETPPLKIGSISVLPFLQPLLLWLIDALPTAYLLAILLPSIRSIVPQLWPAMTVMAVGALLGTAVESTPAGLENVGRIMVAWNLNAFVADCVFKLGGVILSSPLAWLATNAIAAAYRRQWISEQVLVLDSIWIFQTILFVDRLSDGAEDPMWAYCVWFPFILYKVVTRFGFRHFRTPFHREPLRLLLLRVFDQRRQSERLLDELCGKWRYIGIVHLIAAPDLASRIWSADLFLDFISGRLERHFLVEPDDLNRVLCNPEAAVPDSDWRYRLDALFCGDAVWEPAVRNLLPRCHLIVMDLRGFAKANRGCVRELRAIYELTPLSRVILLVDSDTDTEFLRTVLSDCREEVPSESPNSNPSVSPSIICPDRDGVVDWELLTAVAIRGGCDC